MENEKSPKPKNSPEELAGLQEQQQDTYIPDYLRQTTADTRSKTCGITWKMHRADAEASDESNDDKS